MFIVEVKILENKSCCSPDNKDLLSKLIEINPEDRAFNQKSSCCCGVNDSCSSGAITQYDLKDKWVVGEIQTKVGKVPQVSTLLSFSDTLGSWKARWGVNRMNYKINPGLYAVGSPDDSSPVLVTANYKLTFDVLRKELKDLKVWILVLDTKGINVWCAAGKGTFGTEELVSRIAKTKLSQVVTHKTLILPQLGAPGVSAHVVLRQTGFKVVYGSVRAKDIKAFINSGMKATGEMRTVKFSAYDRLVLTPIELVGTFKISLMIFGVLFLLNLIGIGPFGLTDFYAYVGALITGCVLTPVLLPWIPGRAFAWKGWLLGFLWAVGVNMLNGWPESPSYSLVKALGYLLILPSISAYCAMNFTGASTYTSLSGVLKEMKLAVPAITQL
ncbi:MAG: Corrinoid/iron-sulfur protein large subunit [Pelotomaculum sp. PtaB.Bin013]|nr:MAG: Corrinoid/iron-sulfur protein large subunit [Pelotomaculum sp. PtaB.Bin013]